MATKLTLTIPDDVIKAAKEYAADSGRSLSDIVENYLKDLQSPKNSKKKKYSSVIRELKGSVPSPQDFDYKKALGEELTKKYSEIY